MTRPLGMTTSVPARARRFGSPTTQRFTVLWLAYLLAASWLDEHPSRVLCPFRRVTGWRCPLCGLSRSTAALLRGDLRMATRQHPLGPAVVLGTGLWLIREWSIEYRA